MGPLLHCLVPIATRQATLYKAVINETLLQQYQIASIMNRAPINSKNKAQMLIKT